MTINQCPAHIVRRGKIIQTGNDTGQIERAWQTHGSKSNIAAST